MLQKESISRLCVDSSVQGEWMRVANHQERISRCNVCLELLGCTFPAQVLRRLQTLGIRAKREVSQREPHDRAADRSHCSEATLVRVW